MQRENRGRAPTRADVETSALLHDARAASTLGIPDTESEHFLEELFTEFGVSENDIHGITEYKRAEPHRAERRIPSAPGSRYAPRVPSSPPLSTVSVAWRVLAVLACLAVLTVGGLTRSNDLFPFGVLDQFSTGTDPDGGVVSTCLQGVRQDGERIDIPFGQRSVGIERADVENSLDAIEADPQLLAPLAAEYDRRHPDREPLRALVLCQRITQLEDGAAHGEPELVEITRWEAPWTTPEATGAPRAGCARRCSRRCRRPGCGCCGCSCTPSWRSTC